MSSLSYFLKANPNNYGAIRVMSMPKETVDPMKERIVYIGCIHGGNSQIYDRLDKLTKYPPDYLIVAGDTTGSEPLEKAKHDFYEEKYRNLTGEYKNFDYFGDLAATLPLEKRKELLSDLEESAQQLLKRFKKLKAKGTKVYLLEGNWDNPEFSGIRQIAGTDITGYFNTHDFFNRHGFPFIKDLKTISTEKTFHILLPFAVIFSFDTIANQTLEIINKKIRHARKLQKTIILVGHADANWKIHHLESEQDRAYGNRYTLIRNFNRAIAFFKPDHVIYPHQHARIRNTQGDLIGVNEKYFLRIVKDSVELVNDPPIKPDHTIVTTTYIPFGYLAEEDV